VYVFSQVIVLNCCWNLLLALIHSSTFFSENPKTRLFTFLKFHVKQESRAVAGNPRDAAVIFDPQIKTW